MLLASATSAAADGTPPPGIASLPLLSHLLGMRSHFDSAIASGPGSVKQQLQDKGSLSPSASITVEDGAFENFDAGESNDAVVVAQAWHWCQNWDGALSRSPKLCAPMYPRSHLEPRRPRCGTMGSPDQRHLRRIRRQHSAIQAHVLARDVQNSYLRQRL